MAPYPSDWPLVAKGCCNYETLDPLGKLKPSSGTVKNDGNSCNASFEFISNKDDVSTHSCGYYPPNGFTWNFRQIWMPKNKCNSSPVIYMIECSFYITEFSVQRRSLHWQQVEEQAPKPVGWKMCFLLMTLVPVQKLCVNIYIYVYAFLISILLYDVYIYIYIYIYIYNGSVVQFWRSCTIGLYLGGVHGSWAECHFLFSLVYQCVLLFDKSLLLGCLWPLLFVLNNTLILGIWCSTIPHLPGCFCPWTFFENIGFNTVLTDPFMSYVDTQLGYSAGEFQALPLIVLAAFGVVD